jgi:predicted dehydrogenase/threonine dehydrogenase-like Zn-dependent dehydrogenase
MKAIRNPALVKKVVDRMSTHGVTGTLELVRARISNEQATGYSCAGIVTEVGAGVDRFRPGDRVCCCGAGYANHAAVNFVPQNLAARLPDAVTFEEGAFGTLGAIALQGVRRCGPALGDRVVVLGLGLLGQLTSQLLLAGGAVVIGVDVRPERVERARSLGMNEGFAVSERDFVAGVLERTDERGADAVIVTAAGGDAALLNRAFDACRRKGRVVLVGDVPIRIQRDKIYRKEIDFLISTSYGPGRYDPEYEEKGRDYPFAYVRWTEGRNLEEIVRLIESGKLAVRPLIDGVFKAQQAADAYAALASEARPIGVLLDYDLETPAAAGRPTWYLSRRTAAQNIPSKFAVGVVGYGNYFQSVLLPLLRGHSGFHLAAVCSRDGLKVRGGVEREGFQRGTTDYRELLADPGIDVVYIATRHNQHYGIAKDAVEAGKAVFVEKPMTMTSEESRILADLVAQKKAILTVGFNRRFSPHAVELKRLLTSIAGTKTLIYRVNAGPLPPNHWILDAEEGGGRLLGEGVHFFDFLHFLAGSRPVRVESVGPRTNSRNEGIILIEFADGYSVGSVIYSGSGSADAGKERVEVFAGGATLILNDFRRLDAYGIDCKPLQTRTVEKGQREQLDDFYRALRGDEDLAVTAEDGFWATWCAEQAVKWS